MFQLRYYKMVQSLGMQKLVSKIITTQLLCISLAQTLHTFHKCSPSKCKFSGFSTVQVKIHQIPHAIFQIKSQFLPSVPFRLKFYML